MITTFHAIIGYHDGQFHGQTVSGHIETTFCQQSQILFFFFLQNLISFGQVWTP